MTFRSRFLRCEGVELHFAEWGDAAAPALVMWHGLTRSGRDFDEIAAALSADWRVICPDTPGRGLSGWLLPDQYHIEVYAAVANSLLAQLGIRQCAWLGTSMGGLLGMRLAAQEWRGHMAALVVNDIGTVLPAAGLRRIGEYVAHPPICKTMAEFSDWMREIYRSFGENPDTFWERLARTSVRRLPNGRFTAHYDPNIAALFSHIREDVDLWTQYERIDCPLLLLRGESSDILPADVAEEMTQRGPKAQLHTFPNCGHAPALATAEQIAVVREFLAGVGG